MPEASCRLLLARTEEVEENMLRRARRALLPEEELEPQARIAASSRSA
jgi:hypothetical protein